MVLNLVDSDFDKAIQSNETTIVDLWADWCGPCKTFTPVFEEVAQDYPQVTFAKMNVDDGMGTATKYGVTNVPTLLVFKGGNLVHKKEGALTEDRLVSITQSYL